ncbi:hypothetical protein BGW80DRAFT_1303229 [Lactifluus volemus]|nr:hypothetical protein BGW80DRAFT_1303229 [Lactifluus volemus]
MLHILWQNTNMHPSLQHSRRSRRWTPALGSFTRRRNHITVDALQGWRRAKKNPVKSSLIFSSVLAFQFSRSLLSTLYRDDITSFSRITGPRTHVARARGGRDRGCCWAVLWLPLSPVLPAFPVTTLLTDFLPSEKVAVPGGVDARRRLFAGGRQHLADAPPSLEAAVHRQSKSTLPRLAFRSRTRIGCPGGVARGGVPEALLPSVGKLGQ